MGVAPAPEATDRPPAIYPGGERDGAKLPDSGAAMRADAAAEREALATRDGGRMEIGPGGVEVVYADGWKEEIEAGRYELKDPSGVTVEERPATERDMDRLLGQAAD